MAFILVIDEYDAFRATMEYCLPKFGHGVCTAPDLVTGLALAATRSVDLVLLDLGWPRLTGLENCAALRRNPVFARVPVVVMTDRLSAEIVARAGAAGAAEIVAKPFQWPDLLAAIGRRVPPGDGVRLAEPPENG